jgi:hypothetical protein
VREVRRGMDQWKRSRLDKAAWGWRHDPSPLPKTVGYSYEIDLCHITKDPRQVLFSPMIPGQLPPGTTSLFRMKVTLQARSIEVESNILRVEISWDGEWSDDRAEIKRHLVIKRV